MVRNIMLHAGVCRAGLSESRKFGEEFEIGVATILRKDGRLE